MRAHFTTIPVFCSAEAQAELNQFLASHKVLGIFQQIVGNGTSSAWAVCVHYLDAPASAPGQPKGSRVDYREVLADREFAVFARLRALRKQLAESEGVPPYALFTNEQLAAMVQRQASSDADLAAISGVGKARIEKYGAAFLAVLKEAGGAASQAEAGEGPEQGR